jgi:hypothetical protein
VLPHSLPLPAPTPPPSALPPSASIPVDLLLTVPAFLHLEAPFFSLILPEHLQLSLAEFSGGIYRPGLGCKDSAAAFRVRLRAYIRPRVEGRRPRALMESALSPSAGHPPPRQSEVRASPLSRVEKSRSYLSRHHPSCPSHDTLPSELRESTAFSGRDRHVWKSLPAAVFLRWRTGAEPVLARRQTAAHDGTPVQIGNGRYRGRDHRPDSFPRPRSFDRLLVP